MTVACPNPDCECRAAWSVFSDFDGCPECEMPRSQLFGIALEDQR